MHLGPAVRVLDELTRAGQYRALVLQVPGQPGQPVLQPAPAARKQHMYLPVLRHPRAGPALGVDRVPLDHHHPAGMIGQDPGGQQPGDAAAQHAGGVEPDGRPLGGPGIRQPREGGNRRGGHDYS
jgi:hypothetical protein